MEASNKTPTASIEEAVLKAKVAQICDFVGYNAITQDSSNILVDLYRRTLYHLARHCMETANNNRRVEPTLLDLVHAYDFVGISIPELKEHVETVKLPFHIRINYDEERGPSNKIQRNLLVDDLLEAEKSSKIEDQNENGENKASSENGFDEEEKPTVPLLMNTYQEITSKFPETGPVKADKKIRLGGRILLRTNTQLKISAPILPEPVPSTSTVEKGPLKLKKKKEKEIKKQRKTKTTDRPKKEIQPIIIPALHNDETNQEVPSVMDDPIPPTPIQQSKGKKKRKNLSREFVLPSPDKSELKTKTKTKTKSKDKGRGGKKTKVAVKPLDPSIAEPPSFLSILAIKQEESPVESVHTNLPIPTPPLPTPQTSIQIPAHVPAQASKQSRGKKKKKSNQFAIVTETVTAANDESESVCPICKGPDDGDLMIQCDSCEEWYHLRCTGLKKSPGDNENWDCSICVSSRKAQKRAHTPVEEPPLKIVAKTPEPTVIVAPPQVQAQPQSHVKLEPEPQPRPAMSSMSQDDLCPECNLPDDGTLMIQCDDPFCAKWFHGKCVSLLEEPKEDESWFCKVCVDKQQSAFKRRRKSNVHAS